MTQLVDAAGLEAAFALPEGPGPYPGVVIIHEVWGLNQDIRDIAGRFASEGYAAVAPDLFSAGGPRFACVARTLLDVTRGGTATVPAVHRVQEWLAARPEVDGERIGVIGFCLGGGFALLAAVGGRFRAASVNYGDVPKQLDDLRGVCPVVGSYGGEDRRLLSHARRLDDNLSELGVPHDVKVYPEAGHSFLHPSKPPFPIPFMRIGYHAGAAEDAWKRIFAFFGEHLRG